MSAHGGRLWIGKRAVQPRRELLYRCVVALHRHPKIKMLQLAERFPEAVSSSRTRARPRASRERTVPIGQASASAASS